MKKPVFLLLLLALALLTCKEEPPPQEQETFTLDERLIGGKWYEIKIYYESHYYSYNLEPKTDNSYYKFNADGTFVYGTETEYGKMLNKYKITFAENDVYSKNGVIYYYKDTSGKELISLKIMSYSFHNNYPYPDTDDYYIQGSLRLALNKIASYGDFITYTIYDVNGIAQGTDEANSIKWRFLVRLKDDGTPYQNYY